MTEYITRCSAHQNVEAESVEMPWVSNLADNQYITQRMLDQDSLPEPRPTQVIFEDYQTWWLILLNPEDRLP